MTVQSIAVNIVMRGPPPQLVISTEAHHRLLNSDDRRSRELHVATSRFDFLFSNLGVI
jgi:hypothetical protein